MKVIILGGGGVLVKEVVLSKGLSQADFVESLPNGDAIWTKLRERSNKIVWANELGRVVWALSRTRNLDLMWFTTNAID